jgi:type I restriction enzyme S subunit
MIGTIGNPVVVKGDVQFSIKNVGLFKKNPTVILPEYLCHYLSSKVFEKQLEDRQLLKGTTQKFIPLGHLRQLLIPIPPIETQHKVLEELESRLSLCDKIDESIDQGLQQAEVLRQSILKKAFEGKLVPQDQNDEPASVLLERIKAERAAAQPEKKRKTKKVKA